jgi:hypothetical protein
MCYLFNAWLKPDFKVIMIFTGVFAAIYFIIWAIVVISIKITEKRLNARLK